jgi:hypothetical protein
MHQLSNYYIKNYWANPLVGKLSHRLYYQIRGTTYFMELNFQFTNYGSQDNSIGIVTRLRAGKLKLHTLQKRSHHLDAFFLTQVYRGYTDCPSALEIVGLRVPVRYIRDFPMFSVSSVSKNCPSSRCASAANVVCRDVDVFGPKYPVVKTYSILTY